MIAAIDDRFMKLVNEFGEDKNFPECDVVSERVAKETSLDYNLALTGSVRSFDMSTIFSERDPSKMLYSLNLDVWHKGSSCNNSYIWHDSKVSIMNQDFPDSPMIQKVILLFEGWRITAPTNGQAVERYYDKMQVVISFNNKGQTTSCMMKNIRKEVSVKLESKPAEPQDFR